MSVAINTQPTPPSLVEVGFAWTPATVNAYTSPFGLVITSPAAAHATTLTFTATTRVANQGADIAGPLTIIEYFWDFGDGTYAYGNPATHSYLFANLQTQTVLRVTDSLGRQWFTRAQMYLT